MGTIICHINTQINPKNGIRFIMYNPQLIWYNKRDVLKIFPITERTYFRRLKKITPEIRIKNFKNRKGKPTTLIHYQDLNKIFKRKRKPSNLKDPIIFRKYMERNDGIL